jgi:hypothetical protein
MHLDERKPDLSHQLDQDADADEDVEDGFRGCLLEASERRARQCIADRHVEVEGV